MDKELIRQDIVTTFSAWRNAWMQFNQQTFNQTPFEDSWTAGQVVQHIKLSAGGFAELLFGATKNADRSVDQHISDFKTILLNFEHKMKSPDFILPAIKEYHQKDYFSIFEEIEAKFRQAVNELDLNLLCLDFEIPQVGFLTRLEAIYFTVYHIQRHIHQLNQIALLVNFPAENAIVATRIFNYPKAMVFKAWSNPDHLKNWWGPAGFTNTFNQFDFREGGRWSFIMHGPEKGNYPNECEFVKINEPSVIAWKRFSKPLFNLVATFTTVAVNQTKVVFKQVFESEEECAKIKFYVGDKNEENFDRLTEELNKMN